jgi:hypothetical protein
MDIQNEKQTMESCHLPQRLKSEPLVLPTRSILFVEIVLECSEKSIQRPQETKCITMNQCS